MTAYDFTPRKRFPYGIHQGAPIRVADALRGAPDTVAMTASESTRQLWADVARNTQAAITALRKTLAEAEAALDVARGKARGDA